MLPNTKKQKKKKKKNYIYTIFFIETNGMLNKSNSNLITCSIKFNLSMYNTIYITLSIQS